MSGFLVATNSWQRLHCVAEDAVQCEPVSHSKFLRKLGKYWEFRMLLPLKAAFQRLISEQNQNVWNEIPFAQELGINTHKKARPPLNAVLGIQFFKISS
jgi:hypothetical protein